MDVAGDPGESHEDKSDRARQARTSSGERPNAGLARELSELARQLQAEVTPEAMMARITGAAVRQVGGAAVACISLTGQSGVRTHAPTDPLAVQVDRVQYTLDEGPCLDSARRQVTVRSDDLRDEPRWPRFARQASELGVRSVLSVQLFVQRSRFGALNMYGLHDHAFDHDDESIGLLLASHAAIALFEDRMESNLRSAMDVRDLVGQAKGILMERFHIGARDAFDLLAASSQVTNRKLTDIATALISTGELPLPIPRRPDRTS